jgi:hypothetical protein
MPVNALTSTNFPLQNAITNQEQSEKAFVL